PETHRRLHGALHRTAESHAALELLGDRLGDERRVDLRLAHLDDVDRHVRVRHLGHGLAQLVDVRTLLADHHARTGGVDRDPALLVRTLDDDLRHGGLLELLHQRCADRDVLVQELAVFAPVGEPARIPGPVDAEPQTDRVDFLSHQLLLTLPATSRTTMVRFENGFSMRAPRPRARAWKRFMTSDLPTWAS